MIPRQLAARRVIPDILIYGHEADFSLRALSRGWKIKFAPHIVVYRNTPPNAMNAFRMSLGIRNFLGIYWRFLSFPLAFVMTAGMMFEYFILAIRSRTLGAYVRGIGMFIGNLVYIIKNRTPINRHVETFWTRLYPFSPGNTLRRFFGIYRISA